MVVLDEFYAYLQPNELRFGRIIVMLNHRARVKY